MAWYLPALLKACLATLLSLSLQASTSSALTYPTPVDFSGKVLKWPLAKDQAVLYYRVYADYESDWYEFAEVVQRSAELWSQVEASYISLAQVEEEEDPHISIYLKRSINDNAYSAGYTEFDEITKDGTPLHCSIYILTDPGFSYLGIAKTILHELGHCLGLGHSLIPEAIMSYRLESNGFALDLDDEAALARLYPRHHSQTQLPPGCAIGHQLSPSPSGTSQAGLLGLLLLPILLAMLQTALARKRLR